MASDSSTYSELEVQPLPQKKADAISKILQPKLIIDTSFLDYAKFNGSSGGYAQDTTKVEVSNLLFSLEYERLHFDWQNVDKLPFGDGHSTPIEQIQRISIFGRAPYRLGEGKLIFSGIGLTSGFEKELSDTITVEGFSFFSKDYSAKDSWQLGGYFKYHPVGTIILPIFEYTHNKDNPERTGMYGHLGFPITQLGYYFSSKIRTDFGAVYRNAIAKLSNDSVISPAGFTYISSWRGEWAWYYMATKTLELKAALKYTLTRTIINYTSDYKKIDEYTVNNSVGAGIGLIYNF